MRKSYTTFGTNFGCSLMDILFLWKTALLEVPTHVGWRNVCLESSPECLGFLAMDCSQHNLHRNAPVPEGDSLHKKLWKVCSFLLADVTDHCHVVQHHLQWLELLAGQPAYSQFQHIDESIDSSGDWTFEQPIAPCLLPNLRRMCLWLYLSMEIGSWMASSPHIPSFIFPPSKGS